MKFRAHDTFFIRKGWLGKGIEHVYRKPDIFVDKSENPMDILGIGANMVKSLRYWLQAVGLTEEPAKGKKIQTLTDDFGKIVFDYDRYIEETGTLCLLQYKLACNEKNATSWYFFFNKFAMSEFTRDDFIREIQKYIMMTDSNSNSDSNSNENEDVALRSLTDDFNCIINTYLPRYKLNPGKISPENNIDCPLGELGLIDICDKKKKTYRKQSLRASIINPWVALAVIADNSNGKDEISLNEILTGDKNLGKIFNLDAITLIDVLHSVEDINMLKIIRTAGLDVVRLTEPNLNFSDCVCKYYKSLNNNYKKEKQVKTDE